MTLAVREWTAGGLTQTPLSELELMAHLYRRAGFGASRYELDAALARGYEAVVDELLHPEREPDTDMELFSRYFPDAVEARRLRAGQSQWIWRMINTRRPLEEKLTLFWHGLFATGSEKLHHPRPVLAQVAMLRDNCLGNFRTLLVQLSKDPAMIYWLDNQQNTKDVHNENYGRELLELFSMGIGNYTEDDVKAAARAFTGWTIRHEVMTSPHGFHDWEFVFRPDLHDDGEKTFLGERGRFDGGDIIDIILRQPATATYIARRLYGFFVSDTPDENAIAELAAVFTRSRGDIRAVMHALLLSEAFRSPQSYYAKVKSPVELVVGVARLVADYREPRPGFVDVVRAPGDQGQDILEPPSVEGWHGGREWIDSGLIIERVNFAAAQLRDLRKPGVRRLVEQVHHRHAAEPEAVVDACLDLLGPLPVSHTTRSALIRHAAKAGRLDWDSRYDASARAVADLLSMVAMSREFQLC